MSRKTSLPRAAAKAEPSFVRVGPWHAVSIERRPSCCGAVQALEGARFLSPQAPLLPLADCTMKTACRCLYKHYADRREKPRRREEITGLRRGRIVAAERRFEDDRRKDDCW